MGISAKEVEGIYERRYASFRGGAAAIVGNYELAHDIVQEGFARALAGRDRFRGGTPEAWIWRIVERHAFDERRRAGRPRLVEDTLPTSLIATDRDPELARAIARLTPRRRLVVFLRYYADLSYEEIGRICGIAQGTVAATLSQAHEDLRVALVAQEVEQ